MMGHLNNPKTISMTELQKLSLKKLRKMQLPLYVRDQKSLRNKGFVVMDIQMFENLGAGQTIQQIKEVKTIPDYRRMGLLWDQAGMTNEEFHQALKAFQEPENYWAARRFLERAPSILAKEIFSLSELQYIIDTIRLRPIFQKAWEHAIHYWSKKSS